MREKVDRNKLLVRFHKRHPDLSYSNLGWVFGGISKQAVFVILKRYKKHKENKIRQWLSWMKSKLQKK